MYHICGYNFYHQAITLCHDETQYVHFGEKQYQYMLCPSQQLQCKLWGTDYNICQCQWYIMWHGGQQMAAY